MAVGCWLPSATTSSFTLKEHDFFSFTNPMKIFALCVRWNFGEFNFVAMAHTTLKLTKVAYLKFPACLCWRVLMCLNAMPQRMDFFFRLFCRFSHYFARAINIEWQKKIKKEKSCPALIWHVRNTHIWLHDWTINCQRFTFTDFYFVDGLGAVYCDVNENRCVCKWVRASTRAHNNDHPCLVWIFFSTSSKATWNIPWKTRYF